MGQTAGWDSLVSLYLISFKIKVKMISNKRIVGVYLAVLVALIYGVITGYSIKCWECRSDGDPKCADPFDNTSFPITDCLTKAEKEHLPGLKATMCRKIRQKVNGEWRYFRSCAFLGEPGVGNDERYCIHRSGTYNIHVEYCTCRKKDGCNGAADRGLSWGLVTSIIGCLIVTRGLLRT